MSNNIFSSKQTTDSVDAELARLIEDAEDALADGDMEQEDFDNAIYAYENAATERYMEILESGVEHDVSSIEENWDISDEYEEDIAA